MLRARDTTDKGDRGSDKHDSSVPPMIISGNAASNVACSRALGRRQHSWAGEKSILPRTEAQKCAHPVQDSLHYHEEPKTLFGFKSGGNY